MFARIFHTLKNNNEGKKMDNKKKYDNNGIYATEDIIELFWGLLKEGYTGLGFGLILDLIEDRLEDTRQTRQDESEGN
jgi:hypothetical protein